MRCADQQWIDRTSQPKGTFVTMKRMLSYDVDSPAW